MAIRGKGFCWSAGHAAKLLLGNPLRTFAVNLVGGFLLWMAKVSIALGSAICAFLYLDDERFEDGDDQISSQLMPVLVRRGRAAHRRRWKYAHTFSIEPC